MGLLVKPDIFIKLSYGTTNILKSIKTWLGNPENLKDTAIKDMTARLENWDDLWLVYVIASLEVEIQKIRGFNNITYLEELLKRFPHDITGLGKSSDFVKLADDLALKIIPLWEQPSIPLNSPSDKVHYIRDLILLRFISLKL